MFCQCLLIGRVYHIPRFLKGGRGRLPYLLSTLPMTPFWLLRMAELVQLLTLSDIFKDKSVRAISSFYFISSASRQLSDIVAFLLFMFAN